MSVFEPAFTTITLAGLSFTWKEAPRRKTREIMRDLVQFEGLNPEDTAGLLDAVNDILDFFYKHHPEMAAQRQKLDDEATEDEIGEALRAVIDVVTAPFVRGKKEGAAD